MVEGMGNRVLLSMNSTQFVDIKRSMHTLEYCEGEPLVTMVPIDGVVTCALPEIFLNNPLFPAPTRISEPLPPLVHPGNAPYLASAFLTLCFYRSPLVCLCESSSQNCSTHPPFAFVLHVFVSNVSLIYILVFSFLAERGAQASPRCPSSFCQLSFDVDTNIPALQCEQYLCA